MLDKVSQEKKKKPYNLLRVAKGRKEYFKNEYKKWYIICAIGSSIQVGRVKAYLNSYGENSSYFCTNPSQNKDIHTNGSHSFSGKLKIIMLVLFFIYPG